MDLYMADMISSEKSRLSFDEGRGWSNYFLPQKHAVEAQIRPNFTY